MIFQTPEEFSYLRDSDRIIQKFKDINAALEKLGCDAEEITYADARLQDGKMSFKLSASFQVYAQQADPALKP
jgi:hypothetical protein